MIEACEMMILFYKFEIQATQWLEKKHRGLTGEISKAYECIGHRTRGGKTSEVAAPTRILVQKQEYMLYAVVQLQNQVNEMVGTIKHI